MKKIKEIWKVIEHWLVIAIFLFTTVGALLMYIFGEELGMAKGSLGHDDNTSKPGIYYGKCGPSPC